jgi:hypothetical protein
MGGTCGLMRDARPTKAAAFSLGLVTRCRGLTDLQCDPNESIG